MGVALMRIMARLICNKLNNLFKYMINDAHSHTDRE